VKLEAGVGRLAGDIADEDLDHRDVLHGVHAQRLLELVALVVVTVHGLVDIRLGRLELGEQVDELVLPDLALDDRLAERAALATVGDGVLDHEERARDGRDASDQPLGLEVLHEVHEAHVLFAEAVAFGDTHVLEEELGRVARLVADLLQRLGDLKALRLGRDEEEAAAVRARVGVRLGEQRDEVGARAVGDERLLAVDHVVAAALLRDGLDAGDVAPGGRLGDAERRDLVAGQRRLQKLVDLLLRAEVADDGGRHVALHEQPHAHAGRFAPR